MNEVLHNNDYERNVPTQVFIHNRLIDNFVHNYKKGNILIVSIITLIIMVILIYGIIDLYNADKIIYGILGFYAFQIYYILHIGWYLIFLIIHIFLILTQLCYTMNTNNYIHLMNINYYHIRYTIIIKILFAIQLMVILCSETDSESIPLYYNLILIEIILSFLLVLYLS